MLQFKEMKALLVDTTKSLNLNILKFSMLHLPENNINFDILVKNRNFSLTSLAECSKINKLARAWLKNENLLNKINLCVYMSEINKEFFSAKEFERFINLQVKIEFKEKLEDRKKFQGFIKLIECDLITLKGENEELKVKWELIDKAFIVPN